MAPVPSVRGTSNTIWPRKKMTQGQLGSRSSTVGHQLASLGSSSSTGLGSKAGEGVQKPLLVVVTMVLKGPFLELAKIPLSASWEKTGTTLRSLPALTSLQGGTGEWGGKHLPCDPYVNHESYLTARCLPLSLQWLLRALNPPLCAPWSTVFRELWL